MNRSQDATSCSGVGINGFGRIGRLVVRAIESNEQAKVVAINVSVHL